MACETPTCTVPLRHGWNTWVLGRVIPSGTEVTALELRAELEQLIGLTPFGFVTSIGTWLPNNKASSIGIHTFLGGTYPHYTDAGALGDAERELAGRAWDTTGIRDLHSIDECDEISAAPGGVTMVLLDFFWSGETTQINWPTTRWIRTPGIPLMLGEARIPRRCSTEVDWYLAEYWGEQGDRKPPETILERAKDSLSGGLDTLVTSLKDAAAKTGEQWLTFQVAIGVAGAAVLWLYLKAK